MKLHLGCGNNYIDGYINIDFPKENHTLVEPIADFYCDVLKLTYEPNSISEIRSHHMFEHFPRAVALAQLIKWHSWLEIGGALIIETPDIIGCAKLLLAQNTNINRVIRHIAGSHEADWAYHLDHWHCSRFKETLEVLGFKEIRCVFSSSNYLPNVTVTACKSDVITIEKQVERAEKLLRKSMVSSAEEAMYNVWKKQLEEALC